MQSYRIGTVSEFEEGTKKVFNLGETEVGVFRLGEKFYAWNNICPHQGGPVCQGRLYPRVHENLDENKHSHGRLYDENNIDLQDDLSVFILTLLSINEKNWFISRNFQPYP